MKTIVEISLFTTTGKVITQRKEKHMEMTDRQMELEILDEGREDTEQLGNCCSSGPARLN